MAIFRGTTGTGSSDNTIVSAVTEQAGIATTKADEAEGFRDEAEGFKNTASASANTATTKASEASLDAANADISRQVCVALRGEAYDSAQDALASADAAEASATTANSSAVQTVAGSNTQVVGVYNNIANVNTVAGVNTDVTTVAGISSDVTTVAADASDIGTVATNIANVNNVGNNIANVNAVHGNASNINTVAADGTDIGTVATNIANVNTVAGISSTVTTVAGLESKMDTVIADASDIGAVAGNIGDVTTVAGINSDVDTVAGIAAKVTTVADNISDVQNADTNATNAASSASNASASATSASNSATTATTKATEASNSATAASNSATTATTKASQAAGSATTATTKASEASTSATNAATSATTATTKASEAASSASAASGSASTAVTKASEASVSAASAATSATNSSNAASTWNNFYNSYLGVADAPPSVDVLGNPIVAGALYYDTGAGSNTVGLYVYNGSSWVYSTNYNNVTAPYSLAQDLATNSHDISFGDNAKAQFGASDDLQIYHDGSNSYVKDTGTGYLILGNSDAGTIIKNGSSQNLLTTTASEIRLGHQGDTKLATKSTGIDVTGTATMDGLTVDGDAKVLGSAANTLIIADATETNGYQLKANTSASADFGFVIEDLAGKDLFKVESNNDISFYEDTGTTPKFFWDASAERLGIGTSNPASKLDVKTTGTTAETVAQFGNNNITGGLQVQTNGNLEWGFNALNSRNLTFSTNQTERLRIDSSGKVGIGTTSPARELSIGNGTGSPNIQLLAATAGNSRIEFGDTDDSDAGEIQYVHSSNYMQFTTNGSEAMRIDSSGKVGIGTSSPSASLHTVGANANATNLATSATNAKVRIQNNSGSSLSSYQGYTGNSWYTQVANGNGTTAYGLSLNPYGGNVGIGTASPSSPLHIFNSGTASGSLSEGITLANNSGSTNNRLPAITWDYGAAGTPTFAAIDTSRSSGTGGNLLFHTASTAGSLTERMRIDTSGNLLVGKTSSGSTIEGAELHNSGAIFAVRDSNPAGAFDRKTNDGDIVQLRKNGTTVGSIGTRFSDMYLGTGDTTLRFNDADDRVNPADATGNARDAVVDLGNTTSRFKDLYLSGGVKGNNLTFSGNGSSEHARIDSSGNLLVGTTSQFTGGSEAPTTVTVDGSVGRKGNRFNDFDDVWSSEDAVIIEGVSSFNPSNSPNAENWYFVKAVAINTGSQNIYCIQTATTLTGKIFTRYNNDVADSGTWTSWVEK